MSKTITAGSQISAGGGGGGVVGMFCKKSIMFYIIQANSYTFAPILPIRL